MLTNENSCRYCNSDDNVKLYPTYDLKLTDYSINLCNVCKCHYLAPKPSDEELAEAYSSSYYGANIEKFSFVIEKVLDYYRSYRAKAVCKYIPADGTILDIGCGNGKFLLSLLNHGNYNLYGNEIDGKSAVRSLRISKINLSIGAIQPNQFEDNMFDVITMFHVFEHLPNPAEMLSIISKALKKDGHLILSFPNIDSFQSRLFKGRWFHIDAPRHLFFFKPNDFINFMKKQGYELVQSNYISLEQNPYGMYQSIMNCFFNKREVLFERLKGNVSYAKEFSYLNILFQKYLFILTFPLLSFIDIFISIFKKNATVKLIFKKTI